MRATSAGDAGDNDEHGGEGVDEAIATQDAASESGGAWATSRPLRANDESHVALEDVQ